MRNKVARLVLRGAFAAAYVFGSPAQATCPLFDRIEYNGESLVVPARTSFPASPRYHEWVQTLGQCSAEGQGRPRYKLAEGQLFLVEFYACGSSLSAAEAYRANEAEVPAVWLNGEIVAYSSVGYCPLLDEKAPVRVFTVSQGMVVRVSTKPRQRQ